MSDYPPYPQPDPNQPPQGPPNSQPYGPYPPVPPRYQTGGYGAPPPQRSGSVFWRIIGLLFTLFFLGILALIGYGVYRFINGQQSRVITLGTGDRLGLVRIEGLISQGADKDYWMESLSSFARNDQVKGVLVRVNSPGGTVGASQEIYDALLTLRQRYHKPVYVSMGDVAASGGYYLSTAADRIYAVRGTLTGSIGVIFSKPEVGTLAQKVGIQMETIKSGRFKDSGAMTRPMTEDERRMFNVLIDDTYHQFTSDVLRWRSRNLEEAMKKLTPAQWTQFQFTRPLELTAESFLAQIADGRAYTGQQALELGLVDELGSLDAAARALAAKVGIKGDPNVIEINRRRSLREMLQTRFGDILPASESGLQYRMVLP